MYYARSPDDAHLIVSSRLEPLARLLPQAPLNEQRLVSLIHWSAGAVDPDRGATVYSGIRRLLPSEVVTAGPHGVRVERTTPRVGSRYRQGRAEDLATELRDRLAAATERAVGPSERVAVFASGGLDSSGLLALAKAPGRGASARDLCAISLQFKGPGDDRPYFAELVKALGVRSVCVSAADAAPWVLKSLFADGHPLGVSGSCLDLLLGETAAKLGVDVALNGCGGDGLCGGSLPFAQLARRGRVLAALNAALRVRVPWPSTRWGRVRSLLLRPFLPRALRRARWRRADREAWMTARFRAVLEKCRDAEERPAGELPDTPDEWMDRLCNRESYLPDTADLGGQGLAMTGSASVDPFMDLDFVRFILEIDPILLSYGHEYRGLYRLAMKGVLPERIRRRQDKAHFAPAVAAAILAANALKTFSDLSSLQALSTRGLVDPIPFRPMFERLLAALQAGNLEEIGAGDEHWELVWQLLSVEAFLREHGVGRDLA
jgi:asparagine synthase (glutamine-hydrolysing)